MPASTPKGEATRARIVESAADLVLARGVASTSLDLIRSDTGTSKSQLFHYFPGGKTELVEAIAALQMERVLEAQRPFLDQLDTWEAWDGWRQGLLAHYRGLEHLACGVGALVAEAGVDVRGHADDWQRHLADGVARMVAAGLVEGDPHQLALSMFTALQGGLMLMKASQSIEPLEAGLDGALTILRAARPSP